MIPYRCMKYVKAKRRECGTRKSMRGNKEPSTVACPKCKSKLHWAVDQYRLQGRKKPNKDNAPACLCHGAKSKKDDKIVYHQGVRIVQGIHRRGQSGCIHAPDFGTNAFEQPDDEQPPF